MKDTPLCLLYNFKGSQKIIIDLNHLFTYKKMTMDVQTLLYSTISSLPEGRYCFSGTEASGGDIMQAMRGSHEVPLSIGMTPEKKEAL